MIWHKRLAALVLALMMGCSCAAAEISFLPQVGAWTAKEYPLRLTVGAEIISEAASGETRLAHLQALVKHLALQVNLQQLQDETWSRVHVMVDSKPAVTVSMREGAGATLLQATGLKNTTCRTAAAIGDPLSLLTGGEADGLSFFGKTGEGARWAREAEVMLAKLAGALAPYGKEKKTDVAIKNMGKAKLKTIYTVPAEEASKLTGLLTPIAGKGELGALVGKLIFSGKQQFQLYQNAEGTILKLTYEGRCGLTEEDMRDVSLSWSLRRDDDNTRDTFTLKTPAVTGNNRNNVTFTRVAQVQKSGAITMKIKARQEQVANKQMTSWECDTDLKSAAEDDKNRLTGSMTLKHTAPDDTTSKLILTPDLLLGQAEKPFAQGKMNVKTTRGSNTLLEANLTLRLDEGEYFNWELTEKDVDLDSLGNKELAALREELVSGITTSLVRHIALLPREDAMYLFADLDEQAVDKIVEISRKALQEEEAQ